MPFQNGKEGWGVYPGVSGVLLLSPLLVVHVCSAWQGGTASRLKSLVPIILQARPVYWVYLRPCTVYRAGLSCYPNAGSH